MPAGLFRARFFRAYVASLQDFRIRINAALLSHSSSELSYLPLRSSLLLSLSIMLVLTLATSLLLMLAFYDVLYWHDVDRNVTVPIANGMQCGCSCTSRTYAASLQDFRIRINAALLSCSSSELAWLPLRSSLLLSLLIMLVLTMATSLLLMLAFYDVIHLLA